jgi:hypothetical protein
MGEAPSREDQIKAARAMVREHNRRTAELFAMATRNGHAAMAHNLAGTILLSQLDADLLLARGAHAD